MLCFAVVMLCYDMLVCYVMLRYAGAMLLYVDTCVTLCVVMFCCVMLCLVCCYVTCMLRDVRCVMLVNFCCCNALLRSVIVCYGVLCCVTSCYSTLHYVM